MPLPPSSSSPSTSTPQSSVPSSPHSWLQTPKPIRVLFSYFPLHTLPANPLPARTLSVAARRKHTLFLYTTAASSDVDAYLVPSFNPTCLKWQTYMLTHGIDFGIAASSNHASPSGALPFLIPAEETQEKQKRKSTSEKPDQQHAAGSQGEGASNPIPASMLQAWIHQHADKPRLGPQAHNASEQMRSDVYLSLIEHRIRPAWLHSLYLTPNFEALIIPLYISPLTSSLPIRLSLAHSLRAAARSEILKVYPTFSANPVAATEAIYAGAESAFEALSSLLAQAEGGGDHGEEEELGGEGGWFFGNKEPGMLDASVFAYTYLLGDEGAMRGKWKETGEGGEGRLRKILLRHGRLMRHMERLWGWAYG